MRTILSPTRTDAEAIAAAPHAYAQSGLGTAGSHRMRV